MPSPGSVVSVAAGAFHPVGACWICGRVAGERYYRCRMDFSEYAEQDPELHAYTGQHVWLVRCRTCGFGQPEALPTLPNFFDRMYDQQWSEGWIETEFAATYKDFIFRTILGGLSRRVPSSRRRLLDVGAHVGRFMLLAQRSGWQVEGIELNPRTAACAEKRTGAPVHQINAQALAADGRRYAAVVLTDVLEHIPEPRRLLESLAALIEPGGWVAVKVPNGSAQWTKERWLARCTSHRVSLAENLVHVNQFSPDSLTLALERAGFCRITVRPGPPELPPLAWRDLRSVASRAARLGAFAASRLPGAMHTPLVLHLQAFAMKDGRERSPR